MVQKKKPYEYMPYFRFCKKCDKKFQPFTKHNHVCLECRDEILRENVKRRRRKNKLLLPLKST